MLVNQDDTLWGALQIIDANSIGVAFAVDESRKLTGIITDGDIRRGLLDGKSLDCKVRLVMNASCVSLPIGATSSEIFSNFSNKIRILPLLDETGRPVDFATPRRLHKIPVAEPDMGGNEMQYVEKCLNDNWISSQGPFVKEFETKFSEQVGVANAISTSSGTTALHLGLAALGIGPGDEVILPSLTFAASINAILYTGATPVLVDVEPDTWNIDPDEIARAITDRTKAVMVVHLYGQPARMDKIKDILRGRDIFLIEDAAEALGAIYKGEPVGSFGDVAAFSFFGNKIITTGEGGMLMVRDPEVAARARILRDHGMNPKRKYWHDCVGFNYRLTNIQAAIGVAQLERLDFFLARKLEIAESYTTKLKDIEGFQFPVKLPESRNMYWLFSVVLDSRKTGISRDELIDAMLRGGIETRPVFPPLHKMPPYLEYASRPVLPVSEHLAYNGLSLPSSPNMTIEAINDIEEFIKHVLNVRNFKITHQNEVLKGEDT